MKRVLLMLSLLVLPAVALKADIRKCRSNDTVTQENQGTTSLMNYLKGSWNVQGSWLVVEGEGKFQKKIKAKISGAEIYAPILNGHFLQKNLSAKVKYHSLELNKNEQKPFSSLTIMTFNSELNQFFSWSYDCSGSFIEGNGEYDKDQNHYRFLSEIVDEKGETIGTLYVLTIIDQDHYSWVIQEKKNDDQDWSDAASGTSTRKTKS